MKDQFLKIAGVKSEKEFYKKFPSEESFMAKHGKQVKKLMQGGTSFSDTMSQLAGSNAFATGVQSLGEVIGGIQQMKDEKQNMLKAQQMKGVSNVALQASMTRPEQVKKKYVRPEDNINTGEEFFPIYGVGTVVAKNGTEIANTFAPNTIYTDLEEAENGKIFGMNLPQFKTNPDFMKLNSSGEKTDIYEFAEKGGADALAKITGGLGSPEGYGVSGAGRVGGGIGKAAGTIFLGPVGGILGQVAGQTIGNLLDKKAEKEKRAKDAIAYNTGQMAIGQGAQALQQANYSYMRDGGMANPQVATSLEGIPLTKLFAPDPTMDTLRAGGHLKSYTAPSERAMYTGRDKFAMGGNLETHWGGYAEPMSYNPYLPDGGETIMFRGQSHDESDGKGNTGIGITYGNSPVEVERGEPAVQLRDGSDGDSNLTVYGNLKIPSFGAAMMGDTKAAGKKFKNYVAELSKIEQKQNKIMDKSVNELDDLQVTTPQDLLSFKTYEANMIGANMKLKDIAKKKENASFLQSAINDTAEEYNLVADDLAKGKVKEVKKGASIKKAQPGVTTREEIKPIEIPTSLNRTGLIPIEVPEDVKKKGIFKTLPRPSEVADEENKFDLMDIANQVIPYLRPTDAETLDPRQLAGEMYALATNQVMPVQAQTFQPRLGVPYDVSLQDIINKNQADYRAAQRMIGYNPAALQALNAQKYQANQQVLSEQFRLNQAMRDKVYAENRNLLNQANLQNLGILDTQYGRQQEALSKTKATTQAALNSIAAKYAQNQLENRTLQTYENLYNYRFDPRFRAINMNAPAQFAPQGSGMSGMFPYANLSSDEYKMLALQQELVEKQQQKQEKAAKQSSPRRNGALVKAIKSM